MSPVTTKGKPNSLPQPGGPFWSCARGFVSAHSAGKTSACAFLRRANATGLALLPGLQEDNLHPGRQAVMLQA